VPRELQAIVGGPIDGEHPYHQEIRRAMDTDPWGHRERLVTKYAWAIPNGAALAALARFGPIVEIGCGTGYWASLMRERGIDVVAYDLHPPKAGNNSYMDAEQYTTVVRGGANSVLRHADRTLFLCWPPPGSPMALNAVVNHYGAGGVHVITAADEGCCGTEEFWDLLEKRYRIIRRVDIPRWMIASDRMLVWRRK
jgi:hypothetical protein